MKIVEINFASMLAYIVAIEMLKSDSNIANCTRALGPLEQKIFVGAVEQYPKLSQHWQVLVCTNKDDLPLAELLKKRLGFKILCYYRDGRLYRALNDRYFSPTTDLVGKNKVGVFETVSYKNENTSGLFKFLINQINFNFVESLSLIQLSENDGLKKQFAIMRHQELKEIFVTFGLNETAIDQIFDKMI